MTGKIETKPDKKRSGVNVVHKLSHRTRLRFQKSAHTKEQLAKAEELLKETPGVQKIEINPDTGSMLVLHDDKAGRTIETAIEKLAETLELLTPEAALSDVGLVQVSHSLYGLVNVIDDKLTKWSNNTFDLKTVVPLALAYVGLRKIAESRSLLGDISPVVLLYYAFDSYYKLQRKNHGVVLSRSDIPAKG